MDSPYMVKGPAFVRIPALTCQKDTFIDCMRMSAQSRLAALAGLLTSPVGREGSCKLMAIP